MAAARLRHSLRDQAARERALNAAAVIAASAGIAAIRSLPVHDAETGKLVTLDAYVRAFVARLDASSGSDFGLDPLAAVFLLMFDSDFLLQARVIPSPFSDEYLSLAELVGMEVQDDHFGLAREAYERSRVSWKVQGDPVAAALHAEAFVIELRLANPVAWDRSARLARRGGTATAAQQKPGTALLQDLLMAAAQRDIAKARILRDQIAALAKPARGDRKGARVFHARGMELFGKRQFAGAEEAFGQAARLDPRDQEALHRLAAALIETNRLDEAEGFLERALIIEPDNPSAWLSMGRLLAMQGAQTPAPGLLPRAIGFIAGVLGIPWEKLINWPGIRNSGRAMQHAREQASGAFFSALLFSHRPANTVASLAVLAEEGNAYGVKEAARITLIDSGKALESSWGAELGRQARLQTASGPRQEDGSLFSLHIGVHGAQGGPGR